MLVVRQAEPKFRTLWRGRESRAEKIEPCVASAEGSTFLTHRPRPATQGSIFSARVAEGFDVFLPVYNAAPPVTAREHRRVRFFGARPGLATQGSNFYGRDSRPRQRVRNFRRAWRATENLEKYLAQQFDFQRAFQFKKFNCWSLAPQSIFDRSGAPKGSIF